ncbi:MAG TPA: response regulator, partial [Chthonomonadales bacterium]|nr:response regulator [Chthonomonadales bacterium]
MAMEAGTLSPGRITLLMVDDDPVITELFRQYMSKQGFRVLTAGSAAEAISLIQREAGAVRLVISDMSMPDLNGTQLAQRLLDLDPTLPVMIATGHDAESSIRAVSPN